MTLGIIFAYLLLQVTLHGKDSDPHVLIDISQFFTRPGYIGIRSLIKVIPDLIGQIIRVGPQVSIIAIPGPIRAAAGLGPYRSSCARHDRW